MARASVLAIVAVVAILAAQAAALFLMGHTPIFKGGYIKLWHGITYSSENSQHISDWYTFSHFIHGFGFYFLLWLFARRLPTGARFTVAVFLEAAWEVFENTDFVINRYREVTISLDYYGDSILNSVMDTIAAAIGFLLACRLLVWIVVTLAIAMEVWVGWAIRDNLTLNIIMLFYPFEAVLRWQRGG